mgnify:CR=1 FL=1
MPHEELLDPQGKTVSLGLHQMNYTNIDHVRIGKHITLEVEADNENDAGNAVDEACNKLLSNPVIEQYSFTLEKI